MADGSIAETLASYRCCGEADGVGQGTRLFPDAGPDIALDLVGSRAFPKGITLQVYRPAGRPEYATD
jgi:hypothetical protein